MPRSLRPLVAFFVGLVLACDAAVVVVHVLNDHTTLIAPRARIAQADAGVQVVPGPGQAFLTGSLDHLAADDAQIGPVATPVTITGERGVSRLTIEGALVGGNRVAISWNGGAPMPISSAGEGGLDLGATHVDVGPDGIVYTLDGATRALVAGTYSIGTSVAVGASGVATPRDGVTFTADAQTVLTTKGNPLVKGDLRRLDLLGPGRLQASGKLTVQFPDRTVNTGLVTFGEGPYRVTVDPSGRAGLTVDAILQGPVDVT